MMLVIGAFYTSEVGPSSLVSVTVSIGAIL
jgi:hypothetical protein